MLPALRLHLSLFLRRLIAAAALAGFALAAPAAPALGDGGPVRLERHALAALVAPARSLAVKAEPTGGTGPKALALGPAAVPAPEPGRGIALSGPVADRPLPSPAPHRPRARAPPTLS